MSKIQSLSRCIINFSKAVHFAKKKKKLNAKQSKTCLCLWSLNSGVKIIIEVYYGAF